MSKVDLTEKRTLTSAFSPTEMLDLAQNESCSKAREYFFKNFICPLITTFWYQEDKRNIATASVTVRLVPDASGKLHPVFSFGNCIEVVEIAVNTALERTDVTQLYSKVFRQNPAAEWGDGLSDALKVAYAECMPDEYFNTPKITLKDCILIAGAEYCNSSGGGQELIFRPLTKLKSKVRKQEHLLVQGDKKHSPLGFCMSQKYGRPYIIASGEWIGLGKPGTCSTECEGVCERIHNSIAAKCAYDDPELY